MNNNFSNFSSFRNNINDKYRRSEDKSDIFFKLNIIFKMSNNKYNNKSNDIEDFNRLAIIDSDKCKPKKCGLDCKRCCPANNSGKYCVEVSKDSINAKISEEFCLGCNICIKKCPFSAIKIVKLPKNISTNVSHKYGDNSFILHKLPMPRQGQILGLVGRNGAGKTTALKILSGEIKPNLGIINNSPSVSDIIKHYRGSDLQNYFTDLYSNKLAISIKPQNPMDILTRLYEEQPHMQSESLDCFLSEEEMKEFDLLHLANNSIFKLSGGELQRFAIAMTCQKKADVYIFDEPTSYLDVKQRINISKSIRKLLNNPKKYIILAEHDLSILDYLSDYICCIFGEASVYGIVSQPMTVREGINNFLSGYIPSENMKFRNEELVFKLTDQEHESKELNTYTYPNMGISLGDFNLKIESGSFSESEITVLIGENGTGKSTFMKLLSGNIVNNNFDSNLSSSISYKPQILEIDSNKMIVSGKLTPSVIVLDYLFEKIGSMLYDTLFTNDILKQMSIQDLLDKNITDLSGGELQRIFIVACLGKPAKLYLLDEPSAFLDSEQRIMVSKIIKKFILNSKVSAFIIEHDIIMTSYLADNVILYEGTPGKLCVAKSPQKFSIGMNKFLKDIDITIRRDPDNYRPRINKYKSLKEQEQKANNQYLEEL